MLMMKKCEKKIAIAQNYYNYIVQNYYEGRVHRDDLASIPSVINRTLLRCPSTTLPLNVIPILIILIHPLPVVPSGVIDRSQKPNFFALSKYSFCDSIYVGFSPT